LLALLAQTQPLLALLDHLAQTQPLLALLEQTQLFLAPLVLKDHLVLL
jgi:hypothetical protein